MDLIIKGIPNQAIADKLLDVARNLIDAYIENQAKILSEEKEAQVLSDKQAFRTANNLSLIEVENEKLGETI